MAQILLYKGVAFDDFTKADEHYWSQITKEEVERFKIPKNLLDECPSQCVSGVQGSDDLADYYIDFPVNETQIVSQ